MGVDREWFEDYHTAKGVMAPSLIACWIMVIVLTLTIGICPQRYVIFSIRCADVAGTLCHERQGLLIDATKN